MAPLSLRRLNRATLARQLLLRREPLSAVEAVRRVVAVQAQHPASPYVALWNRVAGFEPDDLHTAFVEQAVVKATLMRITLHAVDAADYPPFHQAMVSSLRAARLNDRRFTDTGLSIADADALVPDVLSFASEPRSNADVEAWLEARLGQPAPRAWWALRTFAPVVHAATGGPWSHGHRPAYVAARTAPAAGDPAESMRWLVRRYLEGFGPATSQDIAQFTYLRQPVVREALAAMAPTLQTFEAADGGVLHDVPGGVLPEEETPAPPRLMAMWDSSLLAYADRGRMLPAEHRPVVIRRNGDVLPTVLVDGFVAGVWRPMDGGIEVTAFRELPGDTWEALTLEAAALSRFLSGRDPGAYRRYAHWWETMPSAEVRALPG